jgi:hypothetical protein
MLGLWTTLKRVFREYLTEQARYFWATKMVKESSKEKPAEILKPIWLHKKGVSINLFA